MYQEKYFAHQLYQSLVGRAVAKRFVLRRGSCNRLCWYPGKIIGLFYGNKGLTVCIDFNDGERKHYHSLLSDKVVVILPKNPSAYSTDSKTFLNQFTESWTSPYPQPGSTIFINYRGSLIKGHVHQYDQNTRKHQITICGSNTTLHLELFSMRGPRWFWFCDTDCNVRCHRPLNDKCKSKVTEILRSFGQIDPTYEYDERVIQNLIWQLTVWPLFMNRTGWTQYYNTYMDLCTNLGRINLNIDNRLPKDILDVILTYFIPDCSKTIKHNVLYYIL